jgi:hypothetical protein
VTAGKTVVMPFLLGAAGLVSSWNPSATDAIGIFGGATTSTQVVPLTGLTDGATMTGLTMAFKVVSHSNVPATLPSLQVLRRFLHCLLRREGHQVNRKLVYRLYRAEGLAVRRAVFGAVRVARAMS